MHRNVIETVLGAVVLVVAGFFLLFAYKSANLGKVEGYPLTAQFSNVGGLQTGSDVRISGVKVGSVSSQALDPNKYLAVVTLSINPSIKLPRDTVAVIASESLLGGKYLSLEPGGDSDQLASGDRIEFTQSTPGFEQLLGQVIYSLQNVGKSEAGQAQAATPPKN
ncbi:MAG: outer membrane lipid asymmetry maintenance protein MlaD [Azospirillum sp.]|nr:outer membrane lipid asymmetry maintenance protein MlaD [Azospirillum sp.]